MSNSNTHMNDDLLVKYLVGEATPNESAQVQQWINAAEQNRQYYNQFKKIWDESLLVGDSRNIDEDAAFTRLQNRIHNILPKAAEVVPFRPVRPAYWLRIAAALLVFCTIGYFVVSFLNRPVVIINLQSKNRVMTDTLPDGSVVTMNTLSHLAYPKEFGSNNRTVSLNGEAFFKVTPDETKPFIIKVNDVTIKVVGTSFNIKSRNGKTEVIVETGIVNVSKHKNSLNLNPGEKTEVHRGSNSLTKQNISGKLYSYYMNKELVCNQTPLNELVQALNDIYGVRIVIARPSLNKMPITTVFKDQSLEQVLTVIAETFKISVTRKNNQIILK